MHRLFGLIIAYFSAWCKRLDKIRLRGARPSPPERRKTLLTRGALVLARVDKKAAY